jgi:thioredoxin:protein disulfide reductase
MFFFSNSSNFAKIRQAGMGSLFPRIPASRLLITYFLPLERFLMKRFSFIALLFCFICPLSLAQDVPKPAIRVLSTHNSVTVGQEFAIIAEYSIPKGTHLTQNFLDLHLDETPGINPGFLQITPGSFESDELIRREKAYLRLTVHVAESLNPADYTLKGSAGYQICTEGKNFACFPPVQVPFGIKLTVLPSGQTGTEDPEGKKFEAAFQKLSTETEQSLESRLLNALTKKSFFAFLIVFISGFLTSLTPCIYPMIPITIGYIGGKSAGKSKSHGFILSVFYVLGLALIYSALGVLAAITGSLFGSITQTPLVVGIVALIFFIMGLSMLGMFDLTLPSNLATKLQTGGPRKGFLGSFIMGMVAGLVAAPCAGPVIVILLTFITTTRNMLFGFSLMMAFALGMGIIFILLGTFSGLLSSLPQAGMWMDKVKKTFGILLIGAAIFIAHPVLPPPIYGLLIGVALVMLGAVLGAFDAISGDSSAGAKLRKAAGLCLLVSGLFIVVKLTPVPGRVIPVMEERSGAVEKSSSLTWNTNLEQAKLEAKEKSKRLLLDFSADWCAACKELEHKTFPNVDVSSALKDYVLVRVDCTDSRNPEIKSIQESFGVKGLPTLIVLDSQSEELSRITSYLPPSQFLKFLQGADK